ncbi:helix-turn-helix domain-containing protein [Nocardioides pantholopis]|uniref:helix-turn-helix domain-containing protein n=1 Tax=Nocardioides pantholopis TaxID=2483798 RepID=UPI0013DE1EFC|nr:helix-turn-helix domain-containing protein [Nocardioides pantholopis]
MTLIADERRPEGRPGANHGAAPRDGGFDAVATLINRNIAALVGGRDELVERIVAEAITAFFAEPGSPRRAAGRVAPLLWELGERHVARGLPSDTLDSGFAHARAAAQRGFQFVVKLPGTGDQALREDLTAFVQLLHRQASGAWERGHTLLHGDTDRRELLGTTLLRAGSRTPTGRLLRRRGLDPDAEYVLVVSAAGEIPDAVFDDPAVLGGVTRREILLPAGAVVPDLGRHAPRQVVIGPVAPLRSVGRTADPVRRGAQLLGEGRAYDERAVVPCEDLLSVLVTDGLPGLSDLLAAKHLTSMEQLSSKRRVAEGELLLRWLELGQPLNQVARSLDVPPQTAHSRLKHLRGLFGDALDDPTQRLELIVALQATLPRWRREAL